MFKLEPMKALGFSRYSELLLKRLYDKLSRAAQADALRQVIEAMNKCNGLREYERLALDLQSALNDLEKLEGDK